MMETKVLLAAVAQMSAADVVGMLEAATPATIAEDDTIAELRVKLGKEIEAGRANLAVLSQNATVAHELEDAAHRRHAIEEVLEDLGISVKEDSDQPGMWLWTAPTDAADTSFATRELALEAAWTSVAEDVQAKDKLSPQEWAKLSFEAQCSRAQCLYEE